MRHRSLLGVLLLVGLTLPLTSCSVDPALTSINIIPATVNFGGPGLTTQLTAVGYYSRPDHADVTKDITDTVTWQSSAPSCVSVSTTGLIISGNDICSGIVVTAAAPGFHGDIIGQMTVNVTAPPTTAVVTSLRFTQAPPLGSVGHTAQFSVIGRTAAGASVQLQGHPTWKTTDNQVASVDAASGLVTLRGVGSSTIVATYTNPDGTTAVGVAHLRVPAGY
ncbi:MAG TPA: Ig-like domain-containing protein [Terracidiphilus sp.]|nr:Ig-like domain-containing protein [Terracidiphilus sp.]